MGTRTLQSFKNTAPAAAITAVAALVVDKAQALNVPFGGTTFGANALTKTLFPLFAFGVWQVATRSLQDIA